MCICRPHHSIIAIDVEIMLQTPLSPPIIHQRVHSAQHRWNLIHYFNQSLQLWYLPISPGRQPWGASRSSPARGGCRQTPKHFDRESPFQIVVGVCSRFSCKEFLLWADLLAVSVWKKLARREKRWREEAGEERFEEKSRDRLLLFLSCHKKESDWKMQLLLVLTLCFTTDMFRRKRGFAQNYIVGLPTNSWFAWFYHPVPVPDLHPKQAEEPWRWVWGRLSRLGKYLPQKNSIG